MSMEIQLINQIEKFEFLYNFNLPEYNRKDLVDEAWANIAANTNLSGEYNWRDVIFVLYTSCAIFRPVIRICFSAL